jgi:hypothetical protein
MRPRTVMMLAIVATLLATLTMLAFADPGFAATLNVMNANVTGGVTGQGVDQPFGAIKVCVPGSTTQCQVVSGLLIDTGSFGLRIFSQALTVHLPPQMSGPDRVGECAFFGSVTVWGRVATADVTMGGEPTIQNLPVQIINPGFPAVGHRPTSCNQTGHPIARSPQQLNFNGILGVGLRQYDNIDGLDTLYYACTTTNCTGITQPPEFQVQNPVALLPVDNNGVLLNLPQPPTNGASRLTGQLIFGVNTQTNNQIPSSFKEYTADPNTLTFSTVFHRTQLTSFIDSGSNGFFYDNPNLPVCTFAPPWYCPATLTAQSATNIGSDGNSSGLIIFDIANANSLFETSNAAFYDLGANAILSDMFDWGLPFFLGRKIFVGIEGKTISGVSESPPFWAFKAN